MASTRLFTSSSVVGAGGPEGWEHWTPRPDLTPTMQLDAASGLSGGVALGVGGGGKIGVCGGWRKRIENIQGGQAYRLSAFYKPLRIRNETRSVIAFVEWFDAAGKRLRAPDYALPTGQTQGKWKRIEGLSIAPETARSAAVSVGMRWSAVGALYFDDIEMQMDAQPRNRVVKAAAAYLKMRPGESASPAASVERVCRLVDASLAAGTDILCLGEGITCSGTGLKVWECGEGFPGGPTTLRLGELARKHRCYVVAGIYEQHATVIHNTAVLLDREGKLVGSYRKTHLPQEEVEAGLTPGDDYPVFETDFGRIGILICWDVQFPEAARALALKGAEIILVPIWGGNETLVRARAIENHVFVLTSGYDIKTMIVDPAGQTLAEAELDPAKPRVVSAQCNLDRPIYQEWLGNMKPRTWVERRADIAGILSQGVSNLPFASTHSQKEFNFQTAAGHPRLYLRPEDLPVLRRRAQSTHKAEFDRLLDFADHHADEPGPSTAWLPPPKDFTVAARQLAFVYMLTGQPSHGEACVRAVEKVLQATVEGFYSTASRRLRALACVYDWAFAALDEELRERIAEACLAYVRAIYNGADVELEAFLAGHAINMMPSILEAGLAIADEGAGRSMITAVLRWLDRAVPNYKFFLEKGGFQQSYAYTSAYVPDCLALFRLLQSGLGLDRFSENPWLGNAVPWWTYALRSDETFIRYGDYFCAMPMIENPGYYKGFALLAWKYRDTYAQWWVEQFRLSQSHAEIEQFLFEPRDGSVPATPPDSLPRTRFFESMGIAVARGDFDVTHGAQAGGTLAAFRCPPYYLHNHNHRDANQITVYHKGDLAIDSGVYDDYESSHWRNYYVRTIAHNTIVVHDPQEKMILRGSQWANDGGQRWINQPHWAPRDYRELLKDDSFKDGTVLAYREQPDHSYVCGDASHCYAPAKLSRFLRHVVFVLDWPHPAAVSLVVLDEIELARDGLTPRFLLHSLEMPQVDAQRITIRAGKGRLTATALHPWPAKIELIGGSGKEFWVDGRNYPPGKKSQGPHTLGAWRVEISPALAGRRAEFLTLLVPADLDAKAEEPATATPLKDGWTVRQGNLTVQLMRQGSQAPAAGGRTIAVQLARTLH